MKYRVKTYEGLKGQCARRRWAVGIALEDGQTLWGPWLSTGYTKSEKAAIHAFGRVQDLAAILTADLEMENALREG